MKKIITLAFSIIFISAFIFQTSAFAISSEKELFRNNNTAYTQTSFNISNTGEASVFVKYSGYSGITSGATIEITIKKNILLFFWTTVISETYNISRESYFNTYTYDLSENGSGTYKCFVTYTVSGSGGPDDVIPFEDTASY